MPPHPLRSRRAGSRLARLASGVALAAALLAPQLTAPAQAANPVTPATSPASGSTSAWRRPRTRWTPGWRNSPYWAVGIYIAGDSRACRSQPNLTPTWISTQLANGWRLLPITLGAAGLLQPAVPALLRRRQDQPELGQARIAQPRVQGRHEASTRSRWRRGSGIGPGSTLWYDMEAYDVGNTDCRESALAFTSAWTKKLHALDYVSGVYSSAGSGIKALDDVRVEPADRVDAARPHLDRGLGRGRRTPSPTTSATTAGSPATG